MTVQPIELWGHWGAPNPWKVCTILEELDLPYNTQYLELNETKAPDYLKITPNGRLPAIQDPNTGITLWESGAIILYLIDQYDVEGKLSYTNAPQKYLTQQWLVFQLSGQGPYFGQATWFARFHPEKIPSAIDRYMDEVFRVIEVLEEGLARNGTGWLVGGKMTYADLSFVTWAGIGEGLVKQLGKWEGFEEIHPKYTAWLRAMRELNTVKRIEQKIAEGRAAASLV